MVIKDTLTLRNGVVVPLLGFGTWQIKDGKTLMHQP